MSAKHTPGPKHYAECPSCYAEVEVECDAAPDLVDACLALVERVDRDRADGIQRTYTGDLADIRAALKKAGLR